MVEGSRQRHTPADASSHHYSVGLKKKKHLTEQMLLSFSIQVFSEKYNPLVMTGDGHK